MKCQALTKNGTKCKRNAVQHKKYCAQHAKLHKSPRRKQNEGSCQCSI